VSRAKFRRTSGVSDPSLIWAVNDVQPVTPQQEAIVRDQIDLAHPSPSPADRTARAELKAILFDDPMETELLAA
jgi:hypothetical protein